MKLFSARFDPEYPDLKQILLLVVLYFASGIIFYIIATIPVLFGKLIGWEFSLITYLDYLRLIGSTFINIPLIIYVSRKSGTSFNWELKSPGIQLILLLALLAISVKIIVQPLENPVEYFRALIGGSVRQLDFISPDLNFYMLITFIFSVVITPIVEEIFFRKQILGLLQKKYSPAVSIVIGSALFACAHQRLNDIGALFILGLLNSFVYYKTKSLEASIVLHSINNLSVIFMKYEFIDISGMHVFKFIGAMVICAIVILLIISFINRNKKIQADYESDEQLPHKSF